MTSKTVPTVTTPATDASCAVNLVKLFTIDGPVWVDTRQLSGRRTLLTMYTARGNKCKDTGRTKDVREKAAYGVHRDNLYATMELARAAYDALFGAPSPTVPMALTRVEGQSSDHIAS
jgi:hypothetical protein